MINSLVVKSIIAGVGFFALCVVSMFVGGTSIFTPAAGWLLFFSFLASLLVSICSFDREQKTVIEMLVDDKESLAERLKDARMCIKVEERSHERTKRELENVYQQLTQASGIDEPQCQPTPNHISYQLKARMRENQAQQRADLYIICKAIENGYELSEAFTAAYHSGMLWGNDELIANERRYIEERNPSE